MCPGSSSDILIDAPDGRAQTRVHTAVRKTPTKRHNTGVYFEKPDLKVEIVDDGDDDGMAEKFDMSMLTGANEFGRYGDKMPVTPEREKPTYPEPDMTFSSLTAIEKYVIGKAMLGLDISECIAPAELRKIATFVGHLLDVDIMEVYSPEREWRSFARNMG